MRDYNPKNYTEQGGEVTHIGGKLVIDDGADLSALITALQDAGKAGVPVLTEEYLGKKYSDLVGEDIRIGAGGAVVGTIKYVDGYDKAFPGEESGYFFPLILGEEYEGQKIKVKRESGEGGKEKTEQDRTWVLRLTDGLDSVFSFKTESGDPIVTLSFNQATLEPIPTGSSAFDHEKTDYGRFGNEDLYYSSVSRSWEGTECRVTGELKFVKKADHPTETEKLSEDGYYFAFALTKWFAERPITVEGNSKKTVKDTDWVMKVTEESKAKGITVSLDDETIARFDLSGVHLLPREEE